MRLEKFVRYLHFAALAVCLGVLISALHDLRNARALLADADRKLMQAGIELKELEAAAKSRAASKPALSDAEVLELARLRNEVTCLRSEFRTATNAPATPRPAPVAPGGEVPLAPGVVLLTNALSVSIPIGNTLLSGNWPAPEPGKRILSFTTPETTPDAPGSVLVQTRFISGSEELLERIAQRFPRAEVSSDQITPSFTASQFAVFLRALEQADGVDILSTPRVLTQSGQAAQVSVRSRREDGVETGPAVSLTPTLNVTGDIVRLDVMVELALPASKP
ncbi:MAG: hypothetical protein RL514_1486 [Verrucomicrobiota bacterium]|jgi:hypothetical protein